MAASHATQAAEAVELADSDGLPAGERLSLAEMTRIMDVAATLRKERAIVDQQLNIDQIKAKLRERLMEAAKVSGDPVTDAEIAAAVEQYYERLHEFQEPPASFAKFLANVWVLRGTILKAAAAVVVAIGVIWGLLSAGVLPGRRRDERLASNRAAAVQNQFAEVEQLERAINEIATEPDAVREAEALVAAARAASETSDAAKLSELTQNLQALQAVLEQEYTVVIASQPGEQTGLDRYWTDESGTRVSGYYIFVAARDELGNPVAVQVENRETGRIETVSRWAEQVPDAVYERLKADKQADGVLDERAFGVKNRGTRKMGVTLPGADGTPIVRQGQLTKW